MIDGALSCNGAVLDTSLHRMAVTSSKSWSSYTLFIVCSKY